MTAPVPPPPAPYRPLPRVFLAGVELAAGGPGSLVVLAGLSVTWGTDDPLATPPLATATVQLLDRSGRWAVTADPSGQLITIDYRATGTPTGTEQGRIFRGRVAAVQVRPDIDRGWAVVDLSCASVLNDLSNRRSTAAWPVESVQARAARIAAAAARATTQSELPHDSVYGGDEMAPVAAKDQPTILDHINRHYASAGNSRWSYEPRNSLYATDPTQPGLFRRVLRRRYARRALARLVSDIPDKLPVPGVTADKQRLGAYIRSVPLPDTEGVWPTGAQLVSTAPGQIIDGGRTGYDVAGSGIRRELAQRVSTVQVNYPRALATPNYTTVTLEAGVPGVDPVVSGERIASLDVDLTGDTAAARVRDASVDVVRYEGRAWQMDPIVYRAGDNSGGFDTQQLMHMLLCGFEHGQLFFLARSFLPRIGLPPIVGIQGATITYAPDEGGWTIAFAPAPVVNSVTVHPIAWNEVDDGTTARRIKIYTDGLQHADGLHPSVTAEDVRYVSLGSGVTTPGPDYGWDFLL